MWAASSDLRFGAVALALGVALGASNALHADKVHEIVAKGESFIPADITVAPGDTIHWTYVSGDFHTVTSGTKCIADNLYFNEFLHAGSPEVVYVVPPKFEGVIPYFCIPHCGIGMVGTITVEPADTCPADLNNDQNVTVTDLLAILGAWGLNPDSPADLTGDDVVDTVDLLVLLGAWGPCP